MIRVSDVKQRMSDITHGDIYADNPGTYSRFHVWHRRVDNNP